jgi:hypothetical protein
MLRWDKAEVIKSISDFGLRNKKFCVGLVELVGLVKLIEPIEPIKPIERMKQAAGL